MNIQEVFEKDKIRDESGFYDSGIGKILCDKWTGQFGIIDVVLQQAILDYAEAVAIEHYDNSQSKITNLELNPIKGKWEKEGDELLYMINDDYAAISILLPDPADDFDDEYQLTIGYPSNIKAQHFFTGDVRTVKREAGAVADEYLASNDIPTLDNWT